MSKSKSKSPSPPPPDYKSMWEAYQTDVLNLGRDIAGQRAQAAAGGRRLTGEEGKEFEATQKAFYDKGMAQIKKGTAYKTLNKKHGYYFQSKMAKEYGTIKGYEMPKSAQLPSFAGGNFNLANAKRNLSGLNFSGIDPSKLSNTTPAAPPKEQWGGAGPVGRSADSPTGSRWIMRSTLGGNTWS